MTPPRSLAAALILFAAVSTRLSAQSDREIDCHKNDPTPQAIWDIIHAQQHTAFCTNYTFSSDGVTVIPVAGLCEHRGPGGIWDGKLNCNGTMDAHGEFDSGTCDLSGVARCVAFNGTVRTVPYTLSCGSGSSMPMAVVDRDRASCTPLGGGSWVSCSCNIVDGTFGCTSCTPGGVCTKYAI